jgi:hypothetical protein
MCWLRCAHVFPVRAACVQILLDREIPGIIRRLQDMGCWVFALTSRYCSTATRTQKTLEDLGVSFLANTPVQLSSNQALQDPDTLALFHQGVLYTNGVDKGAVLDRFLGNVVLRDALQARSAQRESPDAPQPAVATAAPPSIIFVDDRHENVVSVVKGLRIASLLSISVKGFHFTGAEDIFREARTLKDYEAVLRVQVRTFVGEGRLLSNAEARLCLSTAACT